MSTNQQQSESGTDEQSQFWLRDPFWSRLNVVEGLHLRLQSQHEAVRRELTAVPNARNTGFQEVWAPLLRSDLRARLDDRRAGSAAHPSGITLNTRTCLEATVPQGTGRVERDAGNSARAHC